MGKTKTSKIEYARFFTNDVNLLLAHTKMVSLSNIAVNVAMCNASSEKRCLDLPYLSYKSRTESIIDDTIGMTIYLSEESTKNLPLSACSVFKLISLFLDFL